MQSFARRCRCSAVNPQLLYTSLLCSPTKTPRLAAFLESRGAAPPADGAGYGGLAPQGGKIPREGDGRKRWVEGARASTRSLLCIVLSCTLRTRQFLCPSMPGSRSGCRGVGPAAFVQILSELGLGAGKVALSPKGGGFSVIFITAMPTALRQLRVRRARHSADFQGSVFQEQQSHSGSFPSKVPLSYTVK